MSDDAFDRQLEQTMRRRGDDVPDPEVRIVDLRRIGDREVARRRGLVAGVVATTAVLVVAVLPLAGDRLSSRPSEPVAPASPSPSSSSSSSSSAVVRPGPVPLIVDDTMVSGVGANTVDVALGPDGGVTYQGGVALVGPFYRPATRLGPWIAVGDDGAVDLVPQTTGAPIVSADGTRAAWTSRDDGVDRFVLHDLTTGERLAETEVPTPDQGAYRPMGIDNQDRVFLQDTRLGLVSMWAPGAEPVPVTGTDGIPAEHPWPGGFATIPLSENTGDPATLYEVAADGTATEVGQASRYGVWSPGGDLVAYAEWDPSGGLTPGFGPELLLRKGLGAPMRVSPPEGAPAADEISGVLPVGWESDEQVTAVVLYDEVAGTRQAYWRCDVEQRTCETVVDDLPPAPETNWPDVPAQR